MVRSKEELLTNLKSKLGDDTTDEALSLIEDISDTVADFESKTSDQTDWKKKYEDNDNEWRKKYRDRFYNTGSDDDGNEDTRETEKPMRFEDLFKTI